MKKWRKGYVFQADHSRGNGLSFLPHVHSLAGGMRAWINSGQTISAWSHQTELGIAADVQRLEKNGV